jgi:hypothetical protein
MTWSLSDEPVPPGTIAGRCPMGCEGETLHVGEGGRIVCHGEDCPHPKAVDVLLHQDHDHAVIFTNKGFTIEHPLSERIMHTMSSCPLMDDLRALDGMPVPAPGRYRATKHQPDGHSESYQSDAIGWHFDLVE